MSASMARQGGWVQLDQSDMGLALHMAKMAKGGFLRAAIEQTQFLLMKPSAEVREEKKRGVEFPGHKNVKAAMERHPAMLWENQTDSCLHYQNGTAQNPQTLWRMKGTGAHPPARLRQPTTEPMPHPPATPPVLPGYNEAAQISGIDGVPPRYVSIHTPLPSAQFVNLDAYATHHKRDKDFNPDLLTDDGTSAGQYTRCCLVMQLTSILQPTAANWANVTVKMSIDRMERDFWVYYYPQLADTLKYILKDIFICIIKEQCSDEGENTWRRYKGCQNTINDILGQINW